MRPEDGQGARKSKSNMLAGGATDMKLSIYGRRIRSCMPIQAPQEKSATLQAGALGLAVCSQSSAEVVFDSLPSPRSKLTWQRPTQRKFERRREHQDFRVA